MFGSTGLNFKSGVDFVSYSFYKFPVVQTEIKGL